MNKEKVFKLLDALHANRTVPVSRKELHNCVSTMLDLYAKAEVEKYSKNLDKTLFEVLKILQTQPYNQTNLQFARMTVDDFQRLQTSRYIISLENEVRELLKKITNPKSDE